MKSEIAIQILEDYVSSLSFSINEVIVSRAGENRAGNYCLDIINK